MTRARLPGRPVLIDTSTMTKDDFCCSGDCAQGRNCPRFRRKPEPVMTPRWWLWFAIFVTVCSAAVEVFK